ncbi:MAG TPA: DEAD/DEAH box helicase [Terriglobales bacterium]|nr:DEAD/DEAH box helicase [Terriglobales bacterium]
MTTFHELAISPAILERLTAAQFTIPTPVQAATLAPALAGQDVLATAQTGTGKTLAFLIPAMERLQQAPRGKVTGLILTPTRELAMQIAAQYEQVRPRGLAPAALVVGGLSERPQLEAIRRGAALVVATPGRLEDFLQRRLVRLDGVQLLVLDEADRMLDIGFLPAIRRIAAALPQKRQTLCFSATLAPEVAKLARDCMSEPARIAVGSVSKPVDTVKLHAYEVADGSKLALLQCLLGRESGRCLVFARTKRGTERLAKTLERDGFTATMIHGNRSQSQRTKALHGFQRGNFQILVATDVAARGIHVEDVAHVINYDFPEAPDDFVHRVGRTGRAGGSGLASTFVSRAEMGDLHRMERHLGIRLERTATPAGMPAVAPAPVAAAAPAARPTPAAKAAPEPRRPQIRTFAPAGQRPGSPRPRRWQHHEARRDRRPA